MPTSIQSPKYKILLTAVKDALSSGLLAAQRALEYERLKTYWQIGREIRAAVAGSGGALHLSQPLYRQISQDIHQQTGLDLTVDTIGRMVQFHKNYPGFPEQTTLTFTHYIALQRVHDLTQRRKLEQTAIRQGLTVADIKSQAARLNREDIPGESATPQLVLQRGEPYIYYVHPETGVDGRRRLRIDCGFKINLDFPADNPYQPRQSRVVRSVKEEGRYILQSARSWCDKLYTYAASVIRVVDGDTLDVRFDVGFGIGLYDRVRLKGINAPELATQSGKTAQAFLVKHLKSCPVIIIRTFKEGMYGRWLADIFTLPNAKDPRKIAAQGTYLNQLLLEQGLAEIY